MTCKLCNSNIKKLVTHWLRENCPYSEFFWSVFLHIRAEYGEWSKIRSKKSPNMVIFHAVTDGATVIFSSRWEIIWNIYFRLMDGYGRGKFQVYFQKKNPGFLDSKWITSNIHDRAFLRNAGKHHRRCLTGF